MRAIYWPPVFFKPIQCEEHLSRDGRKKEPTLPVQIHCIAVVIRNEALDRCLDGGSSNFASIAPNSMSYSGGRLSQASFMSPVDAEEFAKQLEIRGLTRHCENPEFVIVSSHNQDVKPACQWLVLFEYEGRLIATVKDSASRKVIAPASDKMSDTNSIAHLSAEEVDQRLEFVERENGIDTFRDKTTGKLLYHVRKTLSDKEIFQSSFNTIWENRRTPGAQVNPDVGTTVRESITKLQGLSARTPDSFQVALALGMGWFILDQPNRAEQSFERATNIEPENTVVLKEWGGVCLELQNWEKAVSLARRAVTLNPDDVELLGNLATSQLLAGSVEDAQKTINHAIELAPLDSVNRAVQGIIKDVVKRKRPRPSTLQMMIALPKPSLLNNLLQLIGLR